MTRKCSQIYTVEYHSAFKIRKTAICDNLNLESNMLSEMSVREKQILLISLMCCAKLLQSCQTLYDSMDYCLPGSSVNGDSPARYCSGLPLPPRDLPHPGMESKTPVSPAFADGFFIPLAPPRSPTFT